MSHSIPALHRDEDSDHPPSALESLAQQLGKHALADLEQRNMQLVLARQGLVLKRDKTAIHIDFQNYFKNCQRGHKQLLKSDLAKAISVQYMPTVVDATCGLAKDAFLLAFLGCHVTALERSDVVFALVDDACQRDSALLTQALKNRLTITQTDALAWLKNMQNKGSQVNCPDVIFLDPMYPSKRKKALPGAGMQLLGQLLGADDDIDQLLMWAKRVAKKRVVIKRPRSAKSTESDLSFCGQSTRYDVFFTNASAK